MITKSNPLVIPNRDAKAVLDSGKIENKITKIQNMDHKITVEREFLLLIYLITIPTIAITAIIGNKKEYKNIISPFKIDL